MDEIWRLQFFGGLRAYGGGKVIERFRTQKTGALLAYLALHAQQTHSRDALIELFWPDSEPDAGRTNLRVAINSLRRQFGWSGDALASLHDSARLHPDAFVTDVAVFERGLRAASRAATPDQQRRCLMEALDAYTGRLLPHLYDDWVTQLQNRLAEQHLGALIQVGTLCEQAGDISMALDFAHCALAADPFCEPVHAALIRLHTAAHQPAMALRHYREWERRLREEFDETPGEDIRRLAASLHVHAADASPAALSPQTRARSSAPALEAAMGTNPARFPAAPLNPSALPPEAHSTSHSQPAELGEGAAPAPASGLAAVPAFARLPPTFTRFFGRLEEREALAALLRNGARLITLTGPGGAGKTRLALELAAQLQARPSDPRSSDTASGRPSELTAELAATQQAKYEAGFDIVCFVSLAEVSEAGRIPAAVAAALGLPRRDGMDGHSQIVERLHGQNALLILDNYEHLADEGALRTRALLRDCPGLACLVTSRQPLHLQGERQFPVPPLPLPLHTGTPERLKEFPSVQLFVDRAQAARPDFALTDRNAPHVAALCARLEGAPLALELAAGWIGVLTPAQMVARMERPFDLLVSRHRDISPRHRTLWGVLEYSHRLLNEEARRVFACLSVFRGGCALDAAQTICAPDAAEPANEAADHRATEEGRASKPRGDFPLEAVLETDAKGRAAQDTVLEALAQLQEHSLLSVTARGQTARYGMLESVRAFALEKLRERDPVGAAQGRHAGYYLDIARHAFAAMSTPGQQAHFDRVEDDYDNMRAILENPPDAQTALHLVSALGPFWSCRGYAQEGREHAARALARADAQDFPHLRARAWITAGNLANDRGDYQAAIAQMEAARALYDTLGHQEGLLMCLCNLGRFLLHSEQYDRAEALLTQALTLTRAQQMRSTEGYVLHSLGTLAARQGAWETSLDRHRQEQAIGEEMGDRHLAASALTGMADAALGRGDLQAAQTLYRQSLQMNSDTGQRGSLHLPLVGLARVADAQGRWERAACLLGVCGAVSANTGMSLPTLERAALKRCEERAQAALGNADFARLYARGHDMLLEEAAAFAMREEEPAFATQQEGQPNHA